MSVTDLTKSIRRRTTGTVQRRRLIVTLFPGDVLGLRLERTRKTETVSLDACYALAVRLRVAEEKRQAIKETRPHNWRGARNWPRRGK